MVMSAEGKAGLERAYKHVQQFSSIVAGFDESGKETVRGAGCTFVGRGRANLIATAGHVIAADNETPPVKGFFYATRPGFSRTAYRFVHVDQRGGRGAADEQWDLACALAHPKLLTEIGRSALPLHRCERTWPANPGSVVLLQGTSADLIVAGVHDDGLPTRTLYENFCLSRVMDPKVVKGAPVNDGIHFFIEHEPIMMSFDDEPHRTPTAVGLSGGGVWAINRVEGRPWSEADISLVGIIRDTLEVASYRWIRATRVAHWMDFMNDCLGRWAAFPKPSGS